MGKYFLGSVGMAEAFRKNNSTGKLELAFVSKTLTDSGLNISTTKDDIRAGTGAPIQFSFYHDSNVEITLTDVLWKKEYLEAQLGADFNDASLTRQSYQSAELEFDNTGALIKYNGVTIDDGKLPVGKEIKELPFACTDTADKHLIWATPKGKDDWKVSAVDIEDGYFNINEAGDTVTTANGAAGVYCVRYLADDDNAKVAEISSLIIPQELFLIITAPIFAGDACAASKGREAGRMTFEIPRFQLNGTQEFSMNMSQNQTMSLAGIAAAAPSEDCDQIGGKLLRIIEVIFDYNWASEITNIIVDGDAEEGEAADNVYAQSSSGIRPVAAKDLLYAASEAGPWNALTNGKWPTAGTYIVKVNGNDTVTQEVEVVEA